MCLAILLEVVCVCVRACVVPSDLNASSSSPMARVVGVLVTVVVVRHDGGMRRLYFRFPSLQLAIDFVQSYVPSYPVYSIEFGIAY